jgi:hypothetical protein
MEILRALRNPLRLCSFASLREIKTPIQVGWYKRKSPGEPGLIKRNLFFLLSSF